LIQVKTGSDSRSWNQINTAKGCHLDAHALTHLDLADDSLLLIENVGNLVCPAAFDRARPTRW